MVCGGESAARLPSVLLLERSERQTVRAMRKSHWRIGQRLASCPAVPLVGSAGEFARIAKHRSRSGYGERFSLNGGVLHRIGSLTGSNSQNSTLWVTFTF